LDHDHLIKLLTISHNYVARQVQSWSDIAKEVTCKFTTPLEFSIVEKIEEVSDKIPEESIDEAMAETRFHLNEKFTFLELSIIIIV
jgi:hypothetical protein